jgi:hypothetical protein
MITFVLTVHLQFYVSLSFVLNMVNSRSLQGAQSRPGQAGQPTGILKKPTDGDSNPSKQVNLVEPLLENRR